MAVLVIRETAQHIETPGWMRQIVAACTSLCESPVSCHFSSVSVSGSLPNGGDGKRLLRRMVEKLAESYDLEVTLDVNGTFFVANFSSANHLD